MSVNSGRRGIEPYAGRICERRDDLTEEVRGCDARVVDFYAIVGGVAAVDAAASEIDADVRTVKIISPEARRLRVPVHGLPLSRMGRAGENDDLVAAALKMPCENVPDLSTSTGYDNAQRTHCRKTTRGHLVECIGWVIVPAVPAEWAVAAAWADIHRLRNTACAETRGSRARREQRSGP